MSATDHPAANPDPTNTASTLADTVVVGHDGSRHADDAFAFALRLAERLGAPVVVIRAWTIDTAPHGTLVSEGYVASFEEGSAKVAHLLERDLAATAAAHPGATVAYRAKFGQPASIMIAESTGALMLVLGTRGRGGFSSLVLGSVSEQCIRHAHCPVLVVRPTARRAPHLESGHAQRT